MVKHRVKSKRKTFTTLLLTAVMVFSFVQFVEQYQNLIYIQGEAEAWTEEYNQAVVETSELEAEKLKLEDPYYIEQLARENLKMIKEGEYLVIPAVESSEVEVFSADYDIDELH